MKFKEVCFIFSIIMSPMAIYAGGDSPEAASAEQIDAPKVYKSIGQKVLEDLESLSDDALQNWIRGVHENDVGVMMSLLSSLEPDMAGSFQEVLQKYRAPEKYKDVGSFTIPFLATLHQKGPVLGCMPIPIPREQMLKLAARICVHEYQDVVMQQGASLMEKVQLSLRSWTMHFNGFLKEMQEDRRILAEFNNRAAGYLRGRQGVPQGEDRISSLIQKYKGSTGFTMAQPQDKTELATMLLTKARNCGFLEFEKAVDEWIGSKIKTVETFFTEYVSVLDKMILWSKDVLNALQAKRDFESLAKGPLRDAKEKDYKKKKKIACQILPREEVSFINPFYPDQDAQDLRRLEVILAADIQKVKATLKESAPALTQESCFEELSHDVRPLSFQLMVAWNQARAQEKRAQVATSLFQEMRQKVHPLEKERDQLRQENAEQKSLLEQKNAELQEAKQQSKKVEQALSKLQEKQTRVQGRIQQLEEGQSQHDQRMKTEIEKARLEERGQAAQTLQHLQQEMKESAEKTRRAAERSQAEAIARVRQDAQEGLERALGQARAEAQTTIAAEVGKIRLEERAKFQQEIALLKDQAAQAQKEAIQKARQEEAAKAARELQSLKEDLARLTQRTYADAGVQAQTVERSAVEAQTDSEIFSAVSSSAPDAPLSPPQAGQSVRHRSGSERDYGNDEGSYLAGYQEGVSEMQAWIEHYRSQMDQVFAWGNFLSGENAGLRQALGAMPQPGLKKLYRSQRQ